VTLVVALGIALAQGCERAGAAEPPRPADGQGRWADDGRGGDGPSAPLPGGTGA
jgi:hypothetical protein